MANQQAPSRAVRVAVIDDEPTLCALVRRLLDSSGAATVVAEASGADGLDEVCAAEPDVVLLDLGLRGTRGTDLIGDIIKACPHAMVAVLTAEAAGQSEEASLAAGAFVFYEKSLLTGDLPQFILDDYALFERALAGEAVAAPSARTRRSRHL